MRLVSSVCVCVIVSVVIIEILATLKVLFWFGFW